MSRTLSVAAAALLLAPAVAAAVPDFAAGRQAGGLTVYPDDRRPGLYYYGPGDLGLATDSAGKPDLRFLQSRYTGTATAGDQGTVSFRSVLSLRVRQLGVGPKELEGVRRALRLVRGNELRPLPIARLEAVLGYTPLRAPAAPVAAAAGNEEAVPGDEAGEQTALSGGHFESEAPVDGPTWLERTYVLSLDPDESQLLWDALHRGRLVLSLAYAFFAAGRNEVPGALGGVGGGALGDALRQQVDEVVRPRGGSGASSAESLPPVVVRAGATAVAVDAGRWPDLFRRVDVNDRLPPGYAGLDVYCYDFNNALRPDLYEKQVEIAAEAVGGPPVALLAAFHHAQPDLYAQSLRFPVAVRLDRPYRYRVTEVGLDGAARAGAWQQASSWGRILDVTTASTDLPPAAAAADKEPR